LGPGQRADPVQLTQLRAGVARPPPPPPPRPPPPPPPGGGGGRAPPLPRKRGRKGAAAILPCEAGEADHAVGRRKTLVFRWAMAWWRGQSRMFDDLDPYALTCRLRRPRDPT